MIKLSQTLLVTKDDFEKQEMYCHKNAYEHIPYARATTYASLANGGPCILLTVQSFGGSDAEDEIIENYSWRKYIALISRAVLNKSKDFGFNLLSLSFNEELNKSKTEGLAARLLLKVNIAEELNDSTMMILTRDITDAINGALPKRVEESTPKEDQVKDFFGTVADEKPVKNEFFEPEHDFPPVKEELPPAKDMIFEPKHNFPPVKEELPPAKDMIFEPEHDFSKPTKEQALQNILKHTVPSMDRRFPIERPVEKENVTSKSSDLNIDDFFNFNNTNSNETSFFEDKDDFNDNYFDTSDIDSSETIMGALSALKENDIENEKEDDEDFFTNLTGEEESLDAEPSVKEFFQTENNHLDTDNDFSEDFTLQSESDSSLENAPQPEDISQPEEFSQVEEEFTISQPEDNSQPEELFEEKEAINDLINSNEIPLLNSNEYKYVLNLEYEDDPIVFINDVDHDVKTTSSQEKLKRVYEKVYKFYITNEKNYTKRAILGEVALDDFVNNVRAHIETYEKIPIEDIDYVVNKIKRSLFSYHVLVALVNNPEISDIRIISASNIIVKIQGKHYKVEGLRFIDNEDYFNFIQSIIIRNKITVTREIILFTDINFCKDYILRFNICLPEINTSGVPCVHIGKVPKDKITLKDLIDEKMLDERIAAYLIDKVKTSKGIIYSGPSRSGKTTLMNALLDYIPKTDSINCMQESDEMYTNVHPNAYMQHIKKDAYGKEVIGLSELGQNSLVCDAQYFIIGEIKGAEARSMLRASNTGHKCWCSVHSASSKETIPRIADYIKLGADYSLQEAERMLKDFEIVIYLEDYKVREIMEIKGYDEEKKSLIYNPVYIRGINGR